MRVEQQRRPTRLLFVVALAAGALSGAIVSTLIARGMVRQPYATTTDQDTGAGVVATRTIAVDDGRAARLESRISRLEQRPESADARRAPSEDPAAAAATVGPPPEFYYRRHAEFIDRVRAESVDPSWGPSTAEHLRRDMEKAKALIPFELVNVDCRTTSCLAVVQWDTQADALNGYHKIMMNPFRVNCEHTILVPEQPAANGKWQVTMTFDCNDWRANGSELGPDVNIAAPK